jgi:hypothetical protein
LTVGRSPSVCAAKPAGIPVEQPTKFDGAFASRSTYAGTGTIRCAW